MKLSSGRGGGEERERRTEKFFEVWTVLNAIFRFNEIDSKFGNAKLQFNYLKIKENSNCNKYFKTRVKFSN